MVEFDSGPWEVAGDQAGTATAPQASGRKAGDAGVISKEGSSQLCCCGEPISSSLVACSACTLVLPKAWQGQRGAWLGQDKLSSRVPCLKELKTHAGSGARGQCVAGRGQGGRGMSRCQSWEETMGRLMVLFVVMAESSDL